MKDLKSFLLLINICLLASAIHAEELAQNTLQQTVEEFNPDAESSTLLFKKEVEQYFHPHGSCGGGSGATGPTGPMGPPGIGLSGPTGATGPAAAGTIIPYSSAREMILVFDPMDSGVIGLALGFGFPLRVFIQDGTIDLDKGGNALAFSMPREGMLTSLSANFFTSEEVDLGQAGATITVQLYSSPAPDMICAPIPDALVTFELSGSIPVGTFFSGIATGLSIPVTAKTRLLIVYTIASNTGDSITVRGFARAGLAIN